MIATIAKRFTFDAAHHLPTVPPDHKCRRLHGHTYEVEFILSGPVGENGFVVDYADIAAAWQPIFDEIDHRLLNDVPGLEVPSTENLCAWMFGRLVDDGRPGLESLRTCLAKIRIYESSTTWCEMTARQWLASQIPGRWVKATPGG
jgi:6-pyruvoyltetrahydropterin/6-carboxytetrahydropterin synthase